jgi:geranylgeranyl diphosphate synthase type I
MIFEQHSDETFATLPIGAHGKTTSQSPAHMTERARAMTEPVLREMIGLLDPWLALVTGYHMGWWDRHGALTQVNASKMLRPALCILAAEAVGAPAPAAIPGAVAVELLHNFSLIHDDIIDQDEERRQRPTLWKEFGIPAAILAGDALEALALETLMTRGGEHGAAAARRMAHAMRKVVRGQAEDMQFAQRPWHGPGAVTLSEYRAMAEAKTGEVLAFAITVGAELGGVPPTVLATLDQAARHFGLAFQAVDDVIGIWGDPKVTGKPIYGDLRERKKTLPIIAAVAASDVVAPKLAELLDGDSCSADDLRLAASWIEQAGGRRAAHAEAQAQIAAAWEHLRSVSLIPSFRSALESLALSFINRVR